MKKLLVIGLAFFSLVTNGEIYGMDFLFGEKPNFSIPSIGIGYSF